MKLAGVDGCRNGWIVALATDWPCLQPVELLFCPDFEAVLAATAACEAVAVDMPIGLPDGPAPRPCDLEAQQALGAQRSSIFLAPPRQILLASSPAEFQRLHREIRGVGAGLPVWGIVPKMREVNEALEKQPSLQDRVFEFHPERTWRRLAAGREISSKKTPAGILDRIAVLNAATAGRWTSPRSYEIPGKPALDDILDAISGLAAAHAFLTQPRIDAPRNACGLRMEIWY